MAYFIRAGDLENYLLSRPYWKSLSITKCPVHIVSHVSGVLVGLYCSLIISYPRRSWLLWLKLKYMSNTNEHACFLYEPYPGGEWWWLLKPILGYGCPSAPGLRYQLRGVVKIIMSVLRAACRGKGAAPQSQSEVSLYTSSELHMSQMISWPSVYLKWQSRRGCLHLVRRSNGWISVCQNRQYSAQLYPPSIGNTIYIRRSKIELPESWSKAPPVTSMISWTPINFICITNSTSRWNLSYQ